MSNKSFNQQLANIRERVPHDDNYIKNNTDNNRKYSKNNNVARVQQLNSPYSFGPLAWKGDGVDHINVNYSSKTIIGKKLSDTFVRVFIHPIFGPFDSFYGLSCWLLDPNFAQQQADEVYRTTHHEDGLGNFFNLRHYAFSKRFNKYIPNYRFYMLQGYLARIKNTRDLREAIISDEFKELSFDSYYFMTEGHGGVGWPVRAKNANWLVSGLNVIREALIQKQEPDLSEFIDDKELLLEEPEIIRQMRESKKNEMDRKNEQKKEHFKKQKLNKAKAKPIEIESLVAVDNKQEVVNALTADPSKLTEVLCKIEEKVVMVGDTDSENEQMFVGDPDYENEQDEVTTRRGEINSIVLVDECSHLVTQTETDVANYIPKDTAIGGETAIAEIPVTVQQEVASVPQGEVTSVDENISQ